MVVFDDDGSYVAKQDDWGSELGEGRSGNFTQVLRSNASDKER